MSYEIVEKSKVVREIIITVPGDAVSSIERKMVEEVRKTMVLPGFRKGKVPASVIRQRAGASITEDARREALQDTVREAISTLDGLIHVGEVDIVTPKTDDGGFVAKVDAEITPVIEVSNYKGLSASAPEVSVTDADVDEVIESKRNRLASLVPVEDRKNVEEGDVVMAELKDPNEAAQTICRAGSRRITVGQGTLNADMEKALIGAEIGSSVEAKATINDQEACVTVQINELKKRVLPNLDDEFAVDTGEAETLAELREKTKENLTKERTEERNNKIEEKLLEQLRAANPIDMPEGYVKTRAVQAVRMQLEQMLHQEIDDSMLGRIAANMKDEELNEYRADYHNEIILNAVADAEKIEVSDDDVLAETRKWFKGMSDDKIKAWLKNSNANDFVGQQVRRDRALEIIKDSATVSGDSAE